MASRVMQTSTANGHAATLVESNSFEPLTPEERMAGVERRTLRSHARASWDAFRRDGAGMLCLAFVAFLVLVALCAPALAPHDPYVQNLPARLTKPCAAYPLGTDELGRCVLSRVIYGCRVSLSVGLASQALALVVGFAVGACAGYLGGRVDAVASFVIQVFSSFPFLLFALVVMYALGPGLQNLYVALGLLMWTGTARLVRGEVMRLKSSEYVLACEVAGGSSRRVIVRHLLPNCLPLLVVTATLGIPNAILCEATLSFLGLGVQPPMASWGQMIAAAQPYVQSSTYYSLAPGAAIFATVMAFNLLGDAVRDAIDPRSHL